MIYSGVLTPFVSSTTHSPVRLSLYTKSAMYFTERSRHFGLPFWPEVFSYCDGINSYSFCNSRSLISPDLTIIFNSVYLLASLLLSKEMPSTNTFLLPISACMDNSFKYLPQPRMIPPYVFAISVYESNANERDSLIFSLLNDSVHFFSCHFCHSFIFL